MRQTAGSQHCKSTRLGEHLASLTNTLHLPTLTSPDVMKRAAMYAARSVSTEYVQCVAVADELRALKMMLAIGAEVAGMRFVTHEGEPVSKSRARYNAQQRRAYTPAKTARGERALKADLRPLFPEPFPGNVAVACIFYRQNRQRIDADNLTKLVCDAATGIAWADDSQVTAIASVLEMDRDNPRTVIAFAPHVSSMDRGPQEGVCDMCGKVYPLRHGRKTQTCGRTCAGKLRSTKAAFRAQTTCAFCGVEFRRERAAQRHCSYECGHAARREKGKARHAGGRNFKSVP